MKARNLYVNQGLPPTQVANLCGLKVHQVAQLAVREGWTKVRRANEARLAARIQSRNDENIDEVSAAIASECDEIALSAVAKSKAALSRDDPGAARDFQALTAGLKNVVTVARTVRGLDQQQEAPTSVNIGFFFAPPGARSAPAELVNVTPASGLAQLGA